MGKFIRDLFYTFVLERYQRSLFCTFSYKHYLGPQSNQPLENAINRDHKYAVVRHMVDKSFSFLVAHIVETALTLSHHAVNC